MQWLSKIHMEKHHLYLYASSNQVIMTNLLLVDFFRELIEEEYRKFGKITTPRLITLDLSWAPILATCDVFCKENLIKSMS